MPRSKQSKRLLLVDADIACFQIACVNQEEYKWDDETISTVLDYEAAIEDLEEFIESLLSATDTQEALFCFSSSPNFRHSVLPTYKHNRKGTEKPKLFYELMDYLREHYPIRHKPNIEADDVMGILATQNPGRYVVASLDKDLLQIPGDHYNWRKEEFTEITPEEGDWNFFMQALTGDPTDGYKGCPGIGKVKAERILQATDPEDYWSAIVETYESKGLSEDDALQQARVARILRNTDYDYKRKRPILWAP